MSYQRNTTEAIINASLDSFIEEDLRELGMGER